MKTYFNLLVTLTMLLFTMMSCSDDDEIYACDNMLRPIVLNFSYFDTYGNDLFFSANPTFSLNDLAIYRYFGNGRVNANYFIAEKPIAYFVVNVPTQDTATFYIALNQQRVDTIFYKASPDQNSFCVTYKIDSIFQNGVKTQVDQQSQVWKFVK